jgi:hypothetical protein
MMKPWTETLPYEHASAGKRANEQTRIYLNRYGARDVTFGDDGRGNYYWVQFSFMGYLIRFYVSAEGYAAKLQQRSIWQRLAALVQARISVWSMLRDQVKATLAPVFIEAVPVTTACMGYIVGPDNRTMGERAAAGEVIRLPPPEEPPAKAA